MPTLRDYFVSESNDYFTRLADAIRRLDAREGDPADVFRLARGLRGSAQLARETRVQEVAHMFENAARAIVAGAIEWTTEISERAAQTLEDMRALVSGGEDGEAAEARKRAAVERWRSIGVEVPEAPVVEGNQKVDADAASRQFRDFAIHEVTGIIAELESCIAQLSADPHSRDSLKAVLRRQRALLGSARLQEISVVAETLRAIEDLARVIAKLGIAVKDEWAAALRAARDVLRGALLALEEGQEPTASPVLSKLRTMRNELLERYGSLESVPAAEPGASPASVLAAQSLGAQPKPAATPVVVPGDPDAVVPIEQLCYEGERALRRALELRAALEQLAEHDTSARETVDEVFDLIRLGIG